MGLKGLVAMQTIDRWNCTRFVTVPAGLMQSLEVLKCLIDPGTMVIGDRAALTALPTGVSWQGNTVTLLDLHSCVKLSRLPEDIGKFER